LCDRFLKLLSSRTSEFANNETFKGCLFVDVGNDTAVDVSDLRALKLFDIAEYLSDRILAGLFVARPFKLNDDDGIARPFATETERIKKYDVGFFLRCAFFGERTDCLVRCEEVIRGDPTARWLR
jgi:hypothetical protein